MSNEIKDRESKQTEEQLDNVLDLTGEVDSLIKGMDSDHLLIDGAKYEIIEDHKEAIDLEKIEERYSSIFEKYDYIVGDVSRDQIRLRGFYEDDDREVPIDMKITYLEDYLTEYCNYGAAYFVLKRLDPPKNFTPYTKENKSKPSKRRNRKSKKKYQNKGSKKSNSSKKNYSKTKRKNDNKNKQKNEPKKQEQVKQANNKTFKIRKKEKNN